MPKRFYNVPEKIGKRIKQKKHNQFNSQNELLKQKILDAINNNPVKDEFFNHDIRKLLEQRYRLTSKKQNKLNHLSKRLTSLHKISPIVKFVIENMLYRFEHNISFKKQNIYLSRFHRFIKFSSNISDIVHFKSNLLNHSKEVANIDLIQVYRMFGNLLSNSYKSICDKHFPNGYQERVNIDDVINKLGKINVNLSLKEKNLVFEVSDNGKGMNKEQLQKLRNGVRTTSSKDQVALHGIGMLSVRRCVDYHKGTIKIDSKEGKGTKTIVSIPVR
jgi:signal transduction histidine kinase